jgi:hypothetical protein
MVFAMSRILPSFRALWRISVKSHRLPVGADPDDFLSSCNAACIFCQNYQISHERIGRRFPDDSRRNFCACKPPAVKILIG